MVAAAAADMEREAGELAAFLISLPSDAEEVDLSSFELIKDFDNATWMKLRGFKDTMKRVMLPPSLLTIRPRAFAAHTQLTNVTFPPSVTDIGERAFFGCSALAMHDLKLPDSLEYLGYDAFKGCSGLTGKLSTHITGWWSFADCTGLSALDLANCKVIEYCCFIGCTGLIGALVPPSSLLSIRDQAFHDCTALTGPLLIPPFVKFIAPHAFHACSSIAGIDQAIGKHFTSFESWKARGNVLMTLITFDEEYRRVVEKNGGAFPQRFEQFIPRRLY
jgi:hypothetical protein